MDIMSIFITGLFAGGLSCLAVQGGLLASSLAQQEEKKLTENALQRDQILPIASFLVSRLIAYTLLGLVLGLLGSVAQLSLSTRVALQFVVAFFMIGTALNLLQVHPIFRYFVIQPPRALTRLVKNQSKSRSIFGPALLGFLTIFIPCGATQAMMAYAVATGSPMSGAVTMFVFILGTSPLFFILGYAAKRFGQSMSGTFNKIAALAIIVIALYNIQGALALSGQDFSLPSQKSEISTQQEGVVEEATIYFNQTNYTSDPEVVNVKAGSSVKLTLVNKNGGGCIQAFTIPKYGIQTVVPIGSTEEVVITAPKASGTIAYMCSMGMYRGVINVM